MKLFKQPTVNRLRLGLLAAAIIFSGAVIFIFLDSRSPEGGKTRDDPPVSANSGLNIGKIHHTATRNGVTEWELEASSAEYITADNQAVLKDLKVTFYLKNNVKAFLKAQKGVLDTNAFDIDVSGHVEMENDGYRLNTEQLNYRHDKRIIYSKTPATFQGNGFYISSDTINIDLNTNRTLLEGRVKGTYNEDFK